MNLLTNNLLSQRDNSYTGQTKEMNDISSDVTCINSTIKSNKFCTLFEKIRSVLNGKDGEYRTDPIDVLSTDDLLCQIKIKAVRAQLALKNEKLEDELLDIIVYSMLTLDKIYRDRNVDPELKRK